jgi:broad specificity phosphatase PhoE
MTTLWLVRHGQTDWNLAGRWQGQAPHAPELNEVGRTQALAIRDQLRDVRLTAVYASDLLRSRQTAEIVAEPYGLPVRLEPRLREINLGTWEGMLSDEIQARFPQELVMRAQDPLNTPAPQGESPSEVATRVYAALDEIAAKHRGESVLIVGHGVSLAVIICRAEGIPLQRVYDHVPDNARPYRVEWE